MSGSGNLDLDQIASAGQSGAYTISNDADDQIASAITEVLTIPVDNTNAATIMIAEKGAAMLREG